jgi:succinyl-CoA synthetase beta subunit
MISKLFFTLKNMYECFKQKDCLFVSANPLLITHDDQFVAANSKIIIDPNALYRQSELKAQLDITQMTSMSRVAYNHDLKYVDLFDGNIGLISNGAALCMATNDLIKDLGGNSSNFLDIQSGSIDAIEDIIASLNLMEDDARVNCILINCFGGNFNIEALMSAVLS